jgi:hypothetical protein
MKKSFSDPWNSWKWIERTIFHLFRPVVDTRLYIDANFKKRRKIQVFKFTDNFFKNNFL